MSTWKAALLGLMIPTALVLPAVAQEGPDAGPRMVFAELDLNGDGAVTLEEMARAQEERFAAADANGDGALDRDEMLAQAAERVARGVDRLIARADADGDGAVTQAELAEARQGRRGPGPEAIFGRFDADGDGSVTEAEFDAAIAEMRERRGAHGGHRGPFGNRDRG